MEQRVTAGNDFNGALPTTTVVLADNLEAFPTDVVGGLFDLNLEAPVLVRSLELKLGGQSVWTIHKRDKDGDELLVLCGKKETDVLLTLADSFVLTDKQKIVVRTTGATAALIARVFVEQAR
jgi:hypothetical protein